jgi:flagellin-like hook-associated protein FlgL
MQENDLVLLGNNEQLVKTNATAYVKNSAPTTLILAKNAVVAKSGVIGTIGTGAAAQDIILQTESETSEYNGYNFRFINGGTNGVTYDAASKTFIVSRVSSTVQATVINSLLTSTSLNTAVNNATGTSGTFTTNIKLVNASNGSDASGVLLPATIISPITVTMSGGVTLGEGLNGEKTQGIARVIDANGTEHNFKTVDDTNADIYSSALNGVTIVFDANASTNSWDAKTGTLTVNISSLAVNDANTVLAGLIATATQTYGAAIKAYNGTATELIDFIDGKVSLLDSIGGGGGYDASQVAALNGLRFTVGGGLGEGDVIESRAETGKITFGTSGKQVSMHTDKATSALNGVSFNFTAEANLAGFNSNTGALTVYLNPATQAITNGKDFEQAVQDAINAAINMNWEQIRRFQDYSFEDPVTISIDLYDETGAGAWLNAADLFSATTADTSFGFPATYSADNTAGAIRGLSIGDPALLISANTLGPEMAGIKIIFEQDDSLQESTTERAYVEVSFDQRTDTERVLTIRANANALQNGTDGGINAALLAAALNANETFNKTFTANAPIWNNNAQVDQTHAVIHFGGGTQFSTAETIGGWDITTNKNGIGISQATSNGIAMTGNNDSNERLIFEAAEYGSEHFVKISVAEGDFKTYCPLGEELNYLAGTDVVATINGQAATAKGTNISIDTTNLSMSMNIQNKSGYTSFSIDGGGALFQLGPNVVSSQQIRLGISSMLSSQLGGASGKLYQLRNNGDADVTKGANARILADAIINETINYVSVLRGRLGAVQRSTLEPNVNMLQDTLTALTEAEAQISNADFAEESSNLTRYQLLLQSGMNTLGIANTFSQYAAQLLQG